MTETRYTEEYKDGKLLRRIPHVVSDEDLAQELANQKEKQFRELIRQGYIVKADSPNEPPKSSHVSTLEAVDASKQRPAKIKRVWEGRDYFYDCYATQTVVDEYQAGKIKIGDFVIVHFDDVGEQIVMAKVFKSW